MAKPSAAQRTIIAKRANTTVGAIKKKQAVGKAHGKERASVRVGTLNTNVLTGQEDLTAWDDEELRRGMRRDKNGGWRGKPPVVVPKAIHDELVRRTLSQAQDLFRDNLVSAVKVLTELVTDPAVEAKDKLRAIQMITDRAMGKDPQTVNVQSDAPWMMALNGAIVSIDGMEVDDEDDELWGEISDDE